MALQACISIFVTKLLTRERQLLTILKNTKTSVCESKEKPPEILITPIKEAKRFMKECFIALCAPKDKAEAVASNLVTADYRGFYTHGMNRLEKYVRDIQKKRTNPCADPEIIKETPASAYVNGNNGFGAITGNFCMCLAMKKAKKCGVSFVSAKCCNHYGISSFYSLQAIEQGLIGLSFTNTSPLMTPIRAKKSCLGTNPIALGAPGLCGDSFVLDMATTAVSLGKIEIMRRKGLPIPQGWAVNEQGQNETDATKAYKAARLLPVGGTEESSGYKGYGLGMLVEIFCGILADANYGPKIRSWAKVGDSSEAANLGTAYMALNPDMFGDHFQDRMQDMMDYLRCMEPADPKKPVMVHGDWERANMAQVDKDGGLRYVANQHETNAKLAKELGIKPPKSFPLKKSCCC
ncbi:uncharacterized oxidoreductase YjmC-like [Anthonomus grandis grandis]|uniref:uncharacterized oxidoreductase YjmC-like n=1 Tax=Anthonomus grandis grandis TaxID=2921223 RepID=UPI002166385A|nr:uncharacterized oxidoreductase YjmC-like [Anthonomus grandis grandis]